MGHQFELLHSRAGSHFRAVSMFSVYIQFSPYSLDCRLWFHCWTTSHTTYRLWGTFYSPRSSTGTLLPQTSSTQKYTHLSFLLSSLSPLSTIFLYSFSLPSLSLLLSLLSSSSLLFLPLSLILIPSSPNPGSWQTSGPRVSTP